jgi:hypothetical protein
MRDFADTGKLLRYFFACAGSIPALTVVTFLSSILLMPDQARAQGLAYSVNSQGLSSLSYGGVTLIGKPGSGVFAADDATSPTFQRADGTTYNGNNVAVSRTLTGNACTATFHWGLCTCNYSRDKDILYLDITVKNNSTDTMTGLMLHVMSAVNFPVDPTWYEGNPGMFYANCGPGTLGQWPIWCDPTVCAPLLHLDYGSGTVDFTNEDVSSTIAVGVPYSVTGGAGKVFDLWTDFPHPAIAPGKSVSTRFGLRFSPSGTSWTRSAGDLLQRYYAQYPYIMQWNDHRPIGMDILCGPAPHPSKNPRGYFNNDQSIDITTEQGKLAFRQRLLARADSIIGVLKSENAQGAVCWDIEGAQDGSCQYYGDPRYVDNIPEMTFTVDGFRTCDAYFQRIAAAGFRIGNCLRPQQLTEVNGRLMQCDSPDPGKLLVDKVKYCVGHWGSSLFYTDSTVYCNAPDGNPYGYIEAHHANEALGADYFEAVHEAFPNVILFPENQDGRDYAYSAPFDGYVGQNVRSTPQFVRDEWPGSFTTIMYQGLKSKDDIPGLVDGVKHGDILMSNCWYPGQQVSDTNTIYDLAGPVPTVELITPATGTQADSGSNLTVSAAASCKGSAIQDVTFYANTTIAAQIMLGRSVKAPYKIIWKHAPPGVYALSARVTTTDGKRQFSAAHIVKLGRVK